MCGGEQGKVVDSGLLDGDASLKTVYALLPLGAPVVLFLLLSFPVAVIMQERVLMITHMHTDRQAHTHAPCALSGLSHYYVIGF